MKKIIDTEFAVVSYDKYTNSIITEWKKPSTTEEVRMVFTLVLEKIKEHRAEAIITDQCQLGLIGTEDRAWLQTEFLPKALASGIRRLATVTANDVFSRFYTERIQSGFTDRTGQFEFKYFDDLESARNWLRKRVAA